MICEFLYDDGALERFTLPADWTMPPGLGAGWFRLPHIADLAPFAENLISTDRVVQVSIFDKEEK